jgi:hypothetical protein
MSNDIHPANSNGHGDYERRDIGVSGVLYFLVGLAVAGLAVYFIANGLFWYLDKRLEAEQAPVSPLVKNAPVDTRRIPPQYKNNEYEKYLKEGFPSPQLEVNERTELNDIRLHEEDTLSTYGWVDQKAGTVHIPIDRAMELLAQRGLPVRTQSSGESSPTQSAKGQPQKAKGNTK